MATVGVIIANLGTPKSFETKDVSAYLREFLMDPYVIDLYWPLRFFLVYGIITNFRSRKTAQNYKKIWMKGGSPLLAYSEKLVKELQKNLCDDYQVELAMRYGEPSLKNVKDRLSHCEKVIFFPQYPQYAESTVRTAIEPFKKIFAGIPFQIVPPFYGNAHYLDAYQNLLESHLNRLDWDHLLMSFHGLPESHLLKADPTGSHCLKSSKCCSNSPVLEHCYRAQCYATAKGLANRLDIAKERYSVSFQSRLGRQKWTEPYTEEMYQKLVSRGVKKLAVICPAFTVDCLETLEEISMAGRQAFLNAGGEEFHFVPCLNDEPAWVEACAQIIKEII
ncbi:MAG: ferrochelatase [Bdellovibrionales bacterium]|nr:ferrochelatase [Bdellovibrionales bacterium]